MCRTEEWADGQVVYRDCFVPKNLAIPFIVYRGECVPITCGPPPHIENGRLSGTGRTFMQNLTLDCDEGMWILIILWNNLETKFL